MQEVWQMQIDPKWGMYGFAALAVISAGGVGILPSYVPTDIAKEIVSTASFIVAVVSGVAAASHGFSSSEPGPFATAPPAQPPQGGK
jgi:hypothetical protein